MNGALYRYVRQMRLAEVGADGQARLLAAEVDLPADGLRSEIASRYLRLAGVKVRLGEGRASAPMVDLGLVNPAARDVGEGALHALVALREALGRAP